MSRTATTVQKDLSMAMQKEMQTKGSVFGLAQKLFSDLITDDLRNAHRDICNTPEGHQEEVNAVVERLAERAEHGAKLANVVSLHFHQALGMVKLRDPREAESKSLIATE